MGFFDKIKDAFDGDHKDVEQNRTVDSPFDPNMDVAPAQPADAAPAEPQSSDMPSLDSDLSSISLGEGTDLPLDGGQDQPAADQPGLPHGEVPADASSIPAEEPAAPAEEPAAAAEPAAPEFPPAAPEAPTAQTYEVVEGDNLTWIGERFGVTVEQLVEANGIENPDLIYPGQVLTIPQA